MKTKSIKTVVMAASAVVAIGLTGAPSAFADDESAVTTTTIGQQAKLANGDVVQAWTVTGLKPSTDEIPYAPQGTLWEATATNEALQGSVQPIVSNLNARAADGQTYRVLFGVATPQGVNPSALAEGQKTSGKVYFDVTGAAPDSVVYNSGGQDLLVWKPAPPAASGSGGGWTPPAQRVPAQTAPVQSAPAATAPAPATGSSGTPITEGTPATPAPAAGSSGTPMTEGTPATPAPAAGSSGTPVTEGTPVTPAPAAGSAGTPANEGAPVAPAPAAGSAGTPAPAEGSSGTPAVVSVPTTTVVGIPHGQGSSGTPAS